MKRLLLIFIVTFCGYVWVMGQGLQNEIKIRHRDFSGRWVFNERESSADQIMVPLPGKIFITIKQNLPAITISTNSDAILREVVPHLATTIYTDGRVFDLFPQMTERGFSATITWEEGKLVTRIFNKSKVLASENQYEIVSGGDRLRISSRIIDSLGRKFDDYVIFDRVKVVRQN